MEQCDVPDKLTMLSYLSQIYDTFRGEIPHIKHPKLVRFWSSCCRCLLIDFEMYCAAEICKIFVCHIQEEPEVKEDHSPPSRIAQLRSLNSTQKVSLLGRIASQHHHHHARPAQIRKPVGVTSSPAVTAGEKKVDSLRRQRKRRSNDKDRIGSVDRMGNIERPKNITVRLQ